MGDWSTTLTPRRLPPPLSSNASAGPRRPLDEAAGTRVSVTKLDFPEPETPVMQVSSPTGLCRSTPLRLFPRAPSTDSIRLSSAGVRCSGTRMARFPERYSPVREPLVLQISFALPWATMSKPVGLEGMQGLCWFSSQKDRSPFEPEGLVHRSLGQRPRWYGINKLQAESLLHKNPKL